MTTHTPQIRSLYRRILRELPSRQPSILSNPSSLQKHVRADLSTASEAGPTSMTDADKSIERRFAEAEQFVQYAKAQRLYATLLERYNPGMNMLEEERVRLTARRVGMEIPEEYVPGKKT